MIQYTLSSPPSPLFPCTLALFLHYPSFLSCPTGPPVPALTKIGVKAGAGGHLHPPYNSFLYIENNLTQKSVKELQGAFFSRPELSPPGLPPFIRHIYMQYRGTIGCGRPNRKGLHTKALCVVCKYRYYLLYG